MTRSISPPKRKRDGTFAHSARTSAYIGQLQRDRFQQLEQELPVPVSDVKRCTICGERKRWHRDDSQQSEFTMLTRKLKSGGKRRYPAGACKPCQAAARRARQAAKPIEVKREEKRRWMANVDKDKLRAYYREYSTMRRRREGVPPGTPWEKYRPTDDSAHIRFPKQPFVEWLTEWLAITGMGVKTFAKKAGIHEKTLRRVLYDDRHQRVSLATLDKAFGFAQLPEVFYALYGEPDSPNLERQHAA